ncbi:hypothetical protein ABFS82_13G062200 [Erythranthe guttata]|uniref:uncharacterized protein LOC105957127 n=1 Tax=Erythranthe guttata TaxID=4155 RepID=UPI00064DFC5E|nr:PREDICTED: uncharacterized protein LOC105957127 [Erythranthe guttata]|eukprot:XP_012836507.1 PREDICTED: uncharacterized protein LOC105957127 [Erythranthe guttata]
MSSSSSGVNSRSSNNKYDGGVLHSPYPEYCDCGLKVRVQTSWTVANPGRRFITCPNKGANSCRFYFWCDPEMCARSKQIIPGLLKKINALECQLELKKKEVKTSYARFAGYTTAIVVGGCILCLMLS